jgi:hypothetical protein
MTNTTARVRRRARKKFSAVATIFASPCVPPKGKNNATPSSGLHRFALGTCTASRSAVDKTTFELDRPSTIGGGRQQKL